MGKLKKYLITHFPLIWNTWVIPVLLINAVVFLAYFVYGYAMAADSFEMNDSYYSSYSRTNPLICIVIMVVTVLVWLKMYNRANAFKSMFPIGLGYLFKEFILICLIWFTTISSPMGMEFGVLSFQKQKVAGLDLKKEIDNANLALHFIPLNIYDFQSKEASNNWESNEESLESIRYAYGEFKDITLHEFQEDQYYSNYNPKSVQKVYSDSLNSVALSWLKTNNKVAIQSCLVGFTEFAERLDVDFVLDPKTLAEDCFVNPEHTIPEKYYAEDVETYCFVDVYSLQHSSNKYRETKREARRSIFRDKTLGIFFLLSVLFSMAIFLSRVTTVKAVLLGFVYAGVYLIVSLVPMVLSGFNNFGENYIMGSACLGLLLAAGFIFASFKKSWSNIFVTFATIAMSIILTTSIFDEYSLEFTFLASALFIVFSGAFIPLSKYLKAKAHE